MFIYGNGKDVVTIRLLTSDRKQEIDIFYTEVIAFIKTEAGKL